MTTTNVTSGRSPLQVIREQMDAYHRLANALDYATMGLERALLPDVGGDGTHHRWISLPHAHFIPTLEQAIRALDGRSEPLSFLDVGAGIGTRLLIAQGMMLRAAGIEIRPEYAAVARRLGLDVWVADAMEWDGYARFDIVYTYRPFLAGFMQANLERRLFELMAPGSVLFMVGGETWPDWPMIAPNLWRKPLD